MPNPKTKPAQPATKPKPKPKLWVVRVKKPWSETCYLLNCPIDKDGKMNGYLCQISYSKFFIIYAGPLKPGESRELTFTIDRQQLQMLDRDLRLIVPVEQEPGASPESGGAWQLTHDQLVL